MKKLLFVLLAFTASIVTNAQMFRVYKNGKIVYAVSNPDSIVGVPPCEPMETVDLGLPSGTLWATCNIGAQVPEDAGDYYQWGALVPIDRTKNLLNNPEAYIFYYTGDAFDSSKFSKYNETDGKQVLDAEDDVASALYGEGWSIPSVEQNEELYKNTTITEESINNTQVLRYTASNGNSIVIPKAGYGYNDAGWAVRNYNNTVYFWLNSLTHDHSNGRYDFAINSGWNRIMTEYEEYGCMYARDWNNYNKFMAMRQQACPVRPVYTPSK